VEKRGLKGEKGQIGGRWRKKGGGRRVEGDEAGCRAWLCSGRVLFRVAGGRRVCRERAAGRGSPQMGKLPCGSAGLMWPGGHPQNARGWHGPARLGDREPRGWGTGCGRVFFPQAYGRGGGFAPGRGLLQGTTPFSRGPGKNPWRWPRGSLAAGATWTRSQRNPPKAGDACVASSSSGGGRDFWGRAGRAAGRVRRRRANAYLDELSQGPIRLAPRGLGPGGLRFLFLGVVVGRTVGGDGGFGEGRRDQPCSASACGSWNPGLAVGALGRGSRNRGDDLVTRGRTIELGPAFGRPVFHPMHRPAQLNQRVWPPVQLGVVRSPPTRTGQPRPRPAGPDPEANCGGMADWAETGTTGFLTRTGPGRRWPTPGGTSYSTRVPGGTPFSGARRPGLQEPGTLRLSFAAVERLPAKKRASPPGPSGGGSPPRWNLRIIRRPPGWPAHMRSERFGFRAGGTSTRDMRISRNGLFCHDGAALLRKKGPLLRPVPDRRNTTEEVRDSSSPILRAADGRPPGKSHSWGRAKTRPRGEARNRTEGVPARASSTWICSPDMLRSPGGPDRFSAGPLVLMRPGQFAAPVPRPVMGF